MNKCKSEGEPGMLLYDVWCKECDCKHQQWKFPCDNNCENGKIAVDPLGYKICDRCYGREYLI